MIVGPDDSDVVCMIAARIPSRVAAKGSAVDMARCAPLSIMNRYAEESVAPSSSTSMAIELKTDPSQ